jgi:hypothetical protein
MRSCSRSSCAGVPADCLREALRLGDGDLFDAVVGDDVQVGVAVEDDRGVREDEVVQGVVALAGDRDGGRGCAGVRDVAGVGVRGGHGADGVREAMAQIGRCRELARECGAELPDVPANVMDASGRHVVG